jgi:hypothetical protein
MNVHGAERYLRLVGGGGMVIIMSPVRADT